MKPALCWNSTWADILLSSLVRCGIRDFFLSPGARSAPLIKALAKLPSVSVTPHYDERGASFAALGAARATNRPSVCITTSGSAVANLLPAATEAFHSQTPVIFLTADRPPELRGKGANQTILQPGIFGSFSVWQADLPCPDPNLAADLPSWIEDAVLAASGAKNFRKGPAHINAPFREPLLPFSSPAPSPQTPPLPLLSLPPLPPAQIPPSCLSAWLSAKRGILLVGELPPSSQKKRNSIFALAELLGWPLFADPLSGLKCAGTNGIDHADFLLKRKDAPRPDFVLHIGGKITSKRIGLFCRNAIGDCYLQVKEQPGRLDPFDQNPVSVLACIEEFCHLASTLVRAEKRQTKQNWLASWLRANRAARALVEQKISTTSSLSSLHLCRFLPSIPASSAASPPPSLFLGNSSAIRDFDAFAHLSSQQKSCPTIFGQRGTSGIDGNVAHIAGIAGTGIPLFAWLGDLAALHDSASFPLLRKKPVKLLVLNNQGGGIFDFLPMDIPAETKAAWITTPHNFSFSALCSQFGIPYANPRSPKELEMLLNAPFSKPTVLEICEPRNEKLQRIQEMDAALQALPSEQLWENSDTLPSPEKP